MLRYTEEYDISEGCCDVKGVPEECGMLLSEELLRSEVCLC
jgi:hypothetical protein